MDKERACDAWAKMKEQARKLTSLELEHHWGISEDSLHSCVDCFCCACGAVLEERGKR